MNKNKMINIIREEYDKRLLTVFRESVRDLMETEMFDAQGNQLLSPGLKVRHKKSGYEYTVDHVEGKGDQAIVYLRHPETPRFKPPGSDVQLSEGDDTHTPIKLDGVDLEKIMGGENTEQLSLDKKPLDPSETNKIDSGSLIKITRQEFEKGYEVK